MPTLDELLSSLPQQGAVRWIGVRAARREPLVPLHEVLARAGQGLDGDRYKGGGGSRQVTLIQAEHLVAVASILGRDGVDPGLVRRNLLVAGINLLSLVGARFRVGEALLEGSGRCHPCSRMEENLGRGGYNAMRGHGGITTRILETGTIRLGDPVVLVRAGTLGPEERD